MGWNKSLVWPCGYLYQTMAHVCENIVKLQKRGARSDRILLCIDFGCKSRSSSLIILIIQKICVESDGVYVGCRMPSVTETGLCYVHVAQKQLRHVYVLQVRFAALKVIEEMSRKLGDSYKVVLPETIVTLTELSEGAWCMMRDVEQQLLHHKFGYCQNCISSSKQCYIADDNWEGNNFWIGIFLAYMHISSMVFAMVWYPSVCSPVCHKLTFDQTNQIIMQSTPHLFIWSCCICLCVCLCSGFRKNVQTDFHKTLHGS